MSLTLQIRAPEMYTRVRAKYTPQGLCGREGFPPPPLVFGGGWEWGAPSRWGGEWWQWQCARPWAGMPPCWAGRCQAVILGWGAAWKGEGSGEKREEKSTTGDGTPPHTSTTTPTVGLGPTATVSCTVRNPTATLGKWVPSTLEVAGPRGECTGRGSRGVFVFGSACAVPYIHAPSE